MTEPILTKEQEVEAQRLAAVILEKAQDEALRLARLLVSKPDEQLLGATEFEVRDRVHALGAFAVEAAVNRRKKGGIKGPAGAAPLAGRRRGSSSTGPRRS